MFTTLALLSTLAGATSYGEKLDLDQLAARADHVVVGEVLTTRQELVKDRGLFTVASIMVEETLEGEPAPVVEVRVPGGRIDDLELTVMGAPRLIQGYEVLLFLDGDQIVGLGQGAFVIENDYAWRATRDDVFVSPRVEMDMTQHEDVLSEYLRYSMADVRRACR